METRQPIHRPYLTKRQLIWFVFVGLLVLATASFQGTSPAAATGETSRTIRIEAHQYHFEPGTVQAARGEHITIELVAHDVVHGLYLDGYDLAVTADPGQTARLSFVADRAGTFRFRCSVSCGAMHPFMIGKLRVGTNNLYWPAAVLALLVAAAGLGLHRKPR